MKGIKIEIARFQGMVVCNNDFTEHNLCLTIDKLASCGIRRIIFTYDYGVSVECYKVYSQIARVGNLVKQCKKQASMSKSFQALRQLKPQSMTIHSPPRYETQDANYIFSISYFCGQGKIDGNLNYSYTVNSFIRYSLLLKECYNKQDISNYILKTPGAVFLFDVNYISRRR